MKALQRFNQVWVGLEPSEQRLIKLATPLIVLLLIYLLLWQPVQAWRANQAQAQQELEHNLHQVASLQQRLVELIELDQRQWIGLATSAGLQQVQAVTDGAVWTLTAQAANTQQVARFLASAAEKGWQWQSFKLQASPLQVELELRPL